MFSTVSGKECLIIITVWCYAIVFISCETCQSVCGQIQSIDNGPSHCLFFKSSLCLTLSKWAFIIANQAFRGYYLSGSALQRFPAVLWLKVEKVHEAGNWCLTCLRKVCICSIAFCLISENWMLQKKLIYIRQQPEVTSRVL